MTKPTVLITGATDGLGRALAQRLAGDGFPLILHGRRSTALRDVADSVLELSGRRPLTVEADLAQLEQVRNLAARVQQETSELTVLVNNAGVGAAQPDSTDRSLTVDGIELRFAVNYLAGALLTLELLPLLRASAPARIVNVASLGQHPLDFTDLNMDRGYSGTRAYGQSKLAQIIFGFELAGRLPASVVTVNSGHPATYMPTKMVLESVGHSVDTLETGVAAIRRLAVDPALDGITGQFFDRQRQATPNRQAADPTARAQLWAATLQLLELDAAAVDRRLG
jgi:NAD(P)-dependent dehydrogenase (short-subunit alcohol dehydrogenase family)